MSSPSRYVMKPVFIEAMQLVGSAAEWHAIYTWVEENTLGSFEPLAVLEGRVPAPESGVSIDPVNGSLLLATPKGVMRAVEGDWIIRDVQGEFRLCTDAIFQDIFQATYEPTGDSK